MVWIFIWDTAPSKIFVWWSEVASVRAGDTKVRPTIQPFWDTITITWTETSNPAQFNPIWSDWADWAVAWDTRFDEWFWYSWVRLNNSWVETAEITQAGSWWFWNLDITQLWTLTSWDNVMIKFPVRWIKMTKSWSSVTLSMTKTLNKSWYQYYAFNKNWTRKNNLYLWAYNWTNSWGYLKSRSWTSAITRFSIDSAVSAANAYWWGIYHEETFYAREYINAMYMMKYGNPNSQSVIWQWYVRWSAAQTTWWTDWIITATWATNTSWTWRIKLFWLEDRWGNVNEWLDWARWDGSYSIQTSSSQAFSSSSRITSFDRSVSVPYLSYAWCISSIVWSNDGMFIWTGTSWSTSTYYCDIWAPPTSDIYFCAWWFYNGQLNSWIFSMLTNSSYSSNAMYWCRLMCLW